MSLQAAWVLTCRAAALCAALAVVCGPALAERADKNKPINLEADSVLSDEVKQVTVVEGHVVMTKGTIALRAFRLEVRKDAEDNQFLLATAKAGERVFFRQKREGRDEYMEGEAERIDYDGKLDVVRLSGKAVMRRLRGSVVADESVGNQIVFNNATETLTLQGAPKAAQASTDAPTLTQRVRMMLSPKEDKTAVLPTGNVPAPTLRPSLQVGQP